MKRRRANNSGGGPGLFTGTGLFLLGVAGVGISNSLYNVDGGHRAVMYSRITGVKKEIYGEGTHLRFPWIETPIVYDIRAKPRSIPSLTGTKGFLRYIRHLDKTMTRKFFLLFPEFTHAVEAKQVAQQEAQRAAFVVDKAKQDKQSTIVKAQGEAQSAQLIGEAILNKPGFVELRKIETAREIASLLSRSSNRLLLNSDALLLNLGQETELKDSY
ncbi:Prohibitin-2, subunit of the prohibitin complex (Phb1p-Phb2p) [Massospora cicadina]|nr:Prohibitin-2, subunit of the prohibitin complex (Phb1p-Phb2p) [Massospora cicadina]